MRTHLAFGILFALILLPHVNSKLIFIPVVLIAVLIPDIDSMSSYLGKNKALRPVQFIVKHRGIFHSLTFCVLVSVLISFVLPALSLPFFIGFASHLFLDSFTVDGIRPFWPSKRELNGGFKTNGKTEKMFFWFLAVVDLFIFVKIFFLK